MLSKSKKGFTIIEVVIVLVIAAIIMLMVFLVVPALQRSQRDSRRQNDARRLLAALEQYASNHDGQYPGVGNTDGIEQVTADYLKEPFNDPNGTPNYGVTTIPMTAANADKANGVLMVVSYPDASCDASGMTSGSGVAISVWQENGGNVCIN